MTEWISLQAAAIIVGCSYSAMRTYARNGRVPIKTEEYPGGFRYLIHVNDVERAKEHITSSALNKSRKRCGFCDLIITKDAVTWGEVIKVFFHSKCLTLMLRRMDAVLLAREIEDVVYGDE